MTDSREDLFWEAMHKAHFKWQQERVTERIWLLFRKMPRDTKVYVYDLRMKHRIECRLDAIVTWLNGRKISYEEFQKFGIAMVSGGRYDYGPFLISTDIWMLPQWDRDIILR
jgi:hypothetical protein